MSLEWNNEQTRFLINEHKNGNKEYHRTPNQNFIIRLKPTMKELKIRGVLLGNNITRNSPQNSGKNPAIRTRRPSSNTTVSTTSPPTPLTVWSTSESLDPFEIGSDISRPVTPSIETPVISAGGASSGPTTPTLPSFSQNVKVINVTINYGGDSKGICSDK
ncbi:hypothetical protein GLOIN_2v1787822 [Rhizophagus clarus]|uniref:Uncharacterized protein n=1 Tax=Rhizophagus clarus TaxID=94130 RepID=A0A8H3L349_9GLOM|nr:hypothetical protein GLOIN_2v1787822 [Rhizophagus clarus]